MRTGCHLIVNYLSRSRKYAAGRSREVQSENSCAAEAVDISANQTLVRQHSTLSVGAVKVAVCMSDSVALIECDRDIESRKHSATSPRIRPVCLPEGNSCFCAAGVRRLKY